MAAHVDPPPSAIKVSFGPPAPALHLQLTQNDVHDVVQAALEENILPRPTVSRRKKEKKNHLLFRWRDGGAVAPTYTHVANGQKAFGNGHRAVGARARSVRALGRNRVRLNSRTARRRQQQTITGVRFQAKALSSKSHLPCSNIAATAIAHRHNDTRHSTHLQSASPSKSQNTRKQSNFFDFNDVGGESSFVIICIGVGIVIIGGSVVVV